jgi:hypothetical protein
MGDAFDEFMAYAGEAYARRLDEVLVVVEAEAILEADRG